MIKVFGTMKSFAFLNWYICVAFSKKNVCTKLTQGHFNHTGCPKNKNGLTLERNLRKKKMIKILSPLKSFAFFIWSICGAF